MRDRAECTVPEQPGAGESTETSLAPACAPQPLGVVSTLAWSAAALAAGLLAAVLFMLTCVARERMSGTSIEPDETAIVWIAATIAELLFFAVIVGACRRSGWRAADYLGLSRPKGHYVRWSMLAFLLSVAAAGVAEQVGPLGGDIDPPIMLPGTAIWFIGGAIVAPVAEELVFRGFLHRSLAASRLGVIGAIVLTSLAWSGLHFDRTWLGSAEIAVAGLALGWLRWRSESTVPTIAVHSLHNTASLLSIMIG